MDLTSCGYFVPYGSQGLGIKLYERVMCVSIVLHSLRSTCLSLFFCGRWKSWQICMSMEQVCFCSVYKICELTLVN